MKECINCKKEFEPNSGKQKFCSGKCKMAFSRNKKLVNTVIKPEFIPKCKEVETISTVTSWVKEIEEFCNKENITPEDLISSYKLKKVIKKEPMVNKSSPLSNNISDSNFGDSFITALRKKKCGL